jgi:hypothetical protein
MTLLDVFGRPVRIVSKSSIEWDRQVSKPQLLVKNFLFPFWKRDNVIEEFLIPGTRLRIDLFNLTKLIAIEVNPDAYHVNYNNFLHKSRTNFLEKIKADEKKRLWCEKNNIELAELYDEDIENLSTELFTTKYNITL